MRHQFSHPTSRLVDTTAQAVGCYCVSLTKSITGKSYQHNRCIAVALMILVVLSHEDGWSYGTA